MTPGGVADRVVAGNQAAARRDETFGKIEQAKYLLQSGDRVYLHPGSVMVKEAPEANMNLFLIFYEKVETKKVYLRDATDISPVRFSPPCTARAVTQLDDCIHISDRWLDPSMQT